ncbi:DUF3828 domain-containing protein [Cyanobium sp. ATX 6A2]|uniref:YbjP/YqhG family protein n=1 Tax=Cyanobium sp. ATX 6A2 TaxID=2823700 RepID=UPI0020CE7FB7|nr:YbjP/YqhG family protein [Cyanobium sp. ATX 6A2]MCP9887497.1 DUF3828 domain-containing protein [Cyanobium sp. ATX 6A2]
MALGPAAGATGLLLLLALAPVGTAGASPVACPAGVIAQIDGLYRWQIGRQNDRGPIELTSQRECFTPALVQQLEDAFRLSPADGRFVDFDVFSGTQVRTFGARVLGCAPAAEGRLDAPVQLRYQLLPVGRGEWRIADISYPGEPRFRLSRFLAELLRSPG